MRTFRVRYLLRYIPHRERVRFCWNSTTVRSANKRLAMRKVSSYRSTVFVISVKEVTQ